MSSPSLCPATKTILAEAEDLVLGDRMEAYGPPDEEFGKVAAIWTALFGDKLASGEDLDGREVALAMVALKLVREVHRPGRDNRRDGAGYFLVADVIAEAKGETDE